MNLAVGQRLLTTFTEVYTLMQIYYHKTWETKPALVNCSSYK